MAVIVTDEQLPTLLEWVKKVPGSEKFCGEILAKIKNVVCDLEFIVDSWPDVKAVVSRSNPNVAKLKYIHHDVDVVATEPTALKTLLQRPNVINWSGKISFASVIGNLIPIVTTLVKQQRVPYYLDDKDVYLKITKDKLKIHAVPQGFQLRSLQVEQSGVINSLWKYSNDTSNAYIKHVIKSRPSCGLYNKEGDLIGYALIYHYGCVGMLHVLEEHRGKGYAKVIISHLTEKCLKEAIDVFSIIEADNAVSIKVHQDVGYEILPNYFFQWINCNFS